jgi:hypothetical protein
MKGQISNYQSGGLESPAEDGLQAWSWFANRRFSIDREESTGRSHKKLASMKAPV